MTSEWYWVAIMRDVLKARNGNRAVTAVALMKRMSTEEQKDLFPELMQLARSAHGPVGAVREIILALPRPWVLSRLDGEVSPILESEEYDDYWMMIELCEPLDPALAVRIARRAALSADAEVSELGLERVERLVAAATADTPEAEAIRQALK